MNISKQKLQQIIIEEYMKEEGIVDEAMSPERADEFVAWIRGKGPKPEWLDRDYGPGSYRRKKGGQAPANDPNVDRSAETMPFPQPDAPDDIPTDDAPESDYSGFQNRAGPAAAQDPEQAILGIVSEMQPDEVVELFNNIIGQVAPEYFQEPEPNPIGFREDLTTMVYDKLLEMGGTMYRGMGSAYKRDEDEIEEGEYRDMEDEGEVYDLLDPHGLADMSDAELVNQAWKDGIEEMIVLDGDGDLINREEILSAMKDV